MVVLLGTSCRLVSPGRRTAGVPESASHSPPETLYSRAETLLQEGRYAEAQEILSAASRESSSPPPPEYYLLQGRLASAQDRPDRARYYLRKLSGQTSDSPAVAEGLLLLADLCYQDRLVSSAFNYYLETVNRFSPLLTETETARLYTRLAAIAFYERRDRVLAAEFLSGVSPERLSAGDARDHQRIRKQLAWLILDSDSLGVRDGNISALEIDGDDLWIGTWNGGVVRYALSADRMEIFRRGEVSLEANTVRTIKAWKGRVWVGSYKGLYSFSRATALWSEEKIFGGAEPIQVEVLEEAAGRLYAGTLGKGLYRLKDRSWEQVPALSDGYVNDLCFYNGKLAVGTMKRGLLMLNPENGAIESFATLAPDLEAGNITLLLVDAADNLWIGTYGRGLYVWQAAEGILRHFSRSQGDIPDDWVLAGALAEGGGSYFGTFGGGVVYFASPSARPQFIGLRDGLPSLDISAVCSSPPFLYFGTLGAGVAIHYAHYAQP